MSTHNIYFCGEIRKKYCMATTSYLELTAYDFYFIFFFFFFFFFFVIEH